MGTPSLEWKVYERHVPRGIVRHIHIHSSALSHIWQGLCRGYIGVDHPEPYLGSGKKRPALYFFKNRVPSWDLSTAKRSLLLVGAPSLEWKVYERHVTEC